MAHERLFHPQQIIRPRDEPMAYCMRTFVVVCLLPPMAQSPVCILFLRQWFRFLGSRIPSNTDRLFLWLPAYSVVRQAYCPGLPINQRPIFLSAFLPVSNVHMQNYRAMCLCLLCMRPSYRCVSGPVVLAALELSVGSYQSILLLQKFLFLFLAAVAI